MPNNDDYVKAIIDTVYNDKGAKKAKEDFKDLSDGAKKAGSNLGKIGEGVKWAVLGQAIKKVTGYIAEVTRLSADYVETLNLLEVAFNGNTESIRKFSSQLADTLNLDDSTILKSAAHFKVLTQSMGIATETGEKLSKLLTKMTLDVSSLYNIDFDKAQTALQYAMEGRGTSLKQRTGVSVLETSVQTTLDAIGVDAYVEDMNDAEKAIARVITMEYQLMSSQGDLARTIEAPANQIRVMKEQFNMLARNIGNVLLPIIAKILPYFNALLIVINAIISALARLFGYKEDMFDTFEDSGTADYFTGVGDAIDGVGKSAENTAKKLQGLRGFDKLNVIKSPTETGSAGGGAGGGGAGGINPKLLDAFNTMADKYRMALDKVKTRATEIAEKILKWLGFQKKINEETGKTEWYFKKITGGTILGALATGGVIYLGINKILKLLNKIGLIKFGSIKEFILLFKNGTIATNITKFTTGFTELATTLGISAGALAAIVAAIVAVGAALIYAYNHNEKFKKSVNDMVSNVLLLFENLLKISVKIFNELWETIEPIWKVIEETITFTVGIIYDTIVFKFQQIVDTISGVATIINDIINGDFDKAFDDLTTMVENLWKNWDEYWSKIKTRFDNWVEDIMKSIGDFIPKALKKLNELNDWLDELPGKFGEAIGKAYKKLKEKVEEKGWKAIGEFIADKIKDGIFTLPNFKITNFGLELGKKIGEEVAKWDWSEIGRQILNGVFKGMSGWNLTSKATQWGADFVNGIKKSLKISSPSKLIINAKIGDFSMEAIAIGMEKQLPLIEKKAEGIVDSLNKGIKNVSIEDLPNLESMFIGNGVGNSLTSNIGNQQNVVGLNQTEKSNKNAGGLNNATFIIQVGDEQVAKKVLKDLNSMAQSNGKPIKIGG